MTSYVESVSRTIYGDVPRQELLDFHYRVLDYENENPITDLPSTGLSADYVLREPARPGGA